MEVEKAVEWIELEEVDEKVGWVEDIKEVVD